MLSDMHGLTVGVGAAKTMLVRAARTSVLKCISTVIVLLSLDSRYLWKRVEPPELKKIKLVNDGFPRNISTGNLRGFYSLSLKVVESRS